MRGWLLSRGQNDVSARVCSFRTRGETGVETVGRRRNSERWHGHDYICSHIELQHVEERVVPQEESGSSNETDRL